MMPTTQIRGTTQIMAGTVPLSALVAGYSVPSANLADGANFLKKDGSVTMTAALNFGGFLASNAAAPVSSGDLTTKAYVDAKTGGIGGVHGVRILNNANLASLSGLAAIDGVTPIAGDIVLNVAQTTASQNGPWVAASGAWARPNWWAAASVVNEGQYFIVAEGTTFKDTKYFLTTVGTITVDTTSTAYVQDSSGAAYAAGTGLTLTGSTFSVNYGTTGTTAAAGNDTRITGALQTTALGAGVQTALGVNIGSAGAALVNGGVLGTPSSGTLTNAIGLPLGTGVTGTLQAAQFPALTGDVTTVAGALAATINHTSGSGFVKYTDFVTNETPGGLINSANTTYTLANTPATGAGGISSLELLYNGEVLEAGAGNDYTLSGPTITMLFTPLTGDKLRAFYMK